MAWNPHCSECVLITKFKLPSEDFPARGLFEEESDQKRLIRQHAVSVIAKVAMLENPLDTFIPYLAMNYMDRFLSNYHMPTAAEGSTFSDKVSLIAVCCFALAANERENTFSLQDLLIRVHNMGFNWMNYHMTSTMVSCIKAKLDNKLHPITPFSFLDHYFLHFKPLGLKRQCVNEILVQAQGEHTFVHFMPTDIAFSACVAAATISFKILPEDINNMLTDEGKKIVKMLIDFCNRKNIEFGPEDTDTEAEENEEPQMVGAISVVEPTKYMDFELKWDVPPLEVTPVQGASKTVTVRKGVIFEEFMHTEIEKNIDTKLIFKVSVRVAQKVFDRWKLAVKNSNKMSGREDEISRIEMEHTSLLGWAKGAIIGKQIVGNYY